MRWYTCVPLLLLAALLVNGCEADRCEEGNAHHGCKLEKNSCRCDYGCKTEYRYSTMQECLAAKERSGNVCSEAPCQHGGSCIQIVQEPGFKCRCESTGYYGQRCERVCQAARGNAGKFPYECVVI